MSRLKTAVMEQKHGDRYLQNVIVTGCVKVVTILQLGSEWSGYTSMGIFGYEIG